MRIAELQLAAFGPFTNRVLALGGPSEPGLCVIHGANEAGKSSALRAIRGFLYGIPAKSPDNFIHPHPELRIGARICFADGVEATLFRRKGTKQTLSSGERDDGGDGGEAGAVAGAIARLEALTESVPESVFAHFYGLDHPGLVEGSRALLEDGGELGRALFGAGLGVVHLRQLIERLESEAAALFVPRGQKQRINAAIAEWKSLQDAIRDQALEPSRFEDQAKRVEGLAARVAGLEAEIEASRAELSRARRLKEARQALARAEEERRDARARIERETEREAALVLAPKILAALERIESLHQELGRYRSTVDQLPRREEAAAALELEISALVSVVGGEWQSADDSLLRRVVARVARVRERVAEAARFEERLEKAIDQEQEARLRLARLAEEGEEGASGERGASLPDPEPLARALDRAKKLGPLDGSIADRARQRAAIQEEAARALERLRLSDLASERLATLALPSADQIERHARRRAEHAAQQERLAERRRGLQGEHLGVHEALGRLRGEGSLPAEADLEVERRARDDLWRRLREGGLDPEARTDLERLAAQRTLAAEFEERMRAADRLSDRLRNEADRVAQGAALVAQAERLDAALALLDREASQLGEAAAALEADWRAIWPPELGDPGPPDSRIEWRAQLEGWFALEGRLRELEDQIERDRAARAAAVEAIREAFGAAAPAARATGSDETLERWIERGEAELARRVETRSAEAARARSREEAREQLDRRTQDRVQAEAQLDRWRVAWREELAASGLPAGIAPRDAEPHLDALARLLDGRAKLAEARSRAGKMRADAERFEAECRDLVATCCPEIVDFGPVQAATRLKSELDRAREQATRADAVRTALAEAREQLELAERRHASSAAALAELAAAPRSGRPGGSPEASGGAPAVGGMLDVDALAARIETLDVRLEAQREERNQLLVELRSERAKLEAMDGNARQAELAEQAEARRAQIIADVERYAELALARQVLEQEIDAYRRANQGPLLELAGRLFGQLTRGAYPTVLSDAGDDGRVRLLALGANRREVPVEALSSGTRDQLFLALRLAALATSFERAETMPLVADDILIEFDDDRTLATLEVLADLGERNQILLFSHHRHVADLARALGERARVVEL